MNQATAQASTADVIIKAPTLEPFATLNQLDCPKCGVLHPSRLLAFILGVRNVHPRIYGVSYCQGGRAPVEDIQSSFGTIMIGCTETRPACGGIVDPHLHLACVCCGHTRLMRVKG